MAIERLQVGQELLNVPMGEMIRSMAMSIAEAQWELDKSSMVVSEIMSGSRPLRRLSDGELLDKKGIPSAVSKEEIAVLDSRVYFGYDYSTAGKRVPKKVSMMELGFVPNFYQFVDTIIEVKIAIKTQANESWNRNNSSDSDTTFNSDGQYVGWSGWGYYGNYGYRNSRTKSVRTSASHVDASYSQKYGYSVEGASLLRTKMVPIPVPSALEQRIQALIEDEAQFFADKTTDTKPTK